MKNIKKNIYGIVIITADGDVFQIGDTTSNIPIQSIAKVFTLAKALEEHSQDVLINKIGVTQSFLPFNSILASEIVPSHTINPFVNAGAMATTSLINGKNIFEVWSKYQQYIIKLQEEDLIYQKKYIQVKKNK